MKWLRRLEDFEIFRDSGTHVLRAMEVDEGKEGQGWPGMARDGQGWPGPFHALSLPFCAPFDPKSLPMVNPKRQGPRHLRRTFPPAQWVPKVRVGPQLSDRMDWFAKAMGP